MILLAAIARTVRKMVSLEKNEMSWDQMRRKVDESANSHVTFFTRVDETFSGLAQVMISIADKS